MKLLWLTDIHLNFLRQAHASQAFGEALLTEQEFDAIVITGDIAEAVDGPTLLSWFARGAQRPIYFVLGNHDFYRGSIAAVEQEYRDLEVQNLTWLDEAEPILLDEHTALVGQGGWYDGRFGSAQKSEVTLSDFELISDFRKHYNRLRWSVYGDRDALLTKIRGLSQAAANQAQPRLEAALALRRTVIFATHYPPFKGACWHQGEISDSHWLPWFTSGAMGEMLANVAAAHPDHRILVLCGHTHSPGVYEHLPNLIVMTGKAVYGAPDVAGLFQLPLEVWVNPDRCDRCDDTDFAISATIITCRTCDRVWGRVNGTWVLDPAS